MGVSNVLGSEGNHKANLKFTEGWGGFGSQIILYHTLYSKLQTLYAKRKLLQNLIINLGTHFLSL